MTVKEVIEKSIVTLIQKTAETTKSEEALQFSEAALNLAKTWCDLIQADNMKPKD